MGARGKAWKELSFLLYITGWIVALLTDIEITGADGD